MAAAGIGGWVRAAAAAGCLVGLAACQSADQSADVAAAQQRISQAELEAFCPPARTREGFSFHTTYAKGGEGDPAKVAYQASIVDVTRDCQRADGMMTITVAAAGRVVPGPAGAPSSVNLPIRVTAIRGSETIHSQLIRQAVPVDPAAGAAQFLVRDSSVVIPIPERRDVVIYVTFDGAKPEAG